MFENILSQNDVIGRLSREIREALLPSALLFYGEPYSGKLTAALELARVLTCRERKGEWNCSCASCSQQRQLLHPETLMLGSRSFSEEIAACAEVLRRHRKPFAQYLFIRSVRKLTRRFDPVLWEGQEAKIKKGFPILESLEGDLELFSPGRDLPEEKEFLKVLEGIQKKAADAVSVIGTDTISVNQVRRVAYWIHTTGLGSTKVVIMEGAEKMQDSSRNALLKTLEESPKNTYFILLSSSKGAIMPTILSRVRSYYFKERSFPEAQEVLSRIFREESGEYHSIREYFLAWNIAGLPALRGAVRNFILFAASESTEFPLEEGTAKRIDKRYLSLFLLELVDQLRLLLGGGIKGYPEIPLRVLENWNALIHETQTMLDTYNLSPLLCMERLLYSMRGRA